MSTIDRLRFTIVDVEGNGQQPPDIVEIAVVPVDGTALAGPPSVWLVKPPKPIAPIVTRKVHGIRDADVADAPSFDQIAPAVLAALDGRIPVAHNARVEYDVLRRHLPGWAPPVMLDTMRLAKAVWPGLSGYGLDPLLAHAGITLDDTIGRRHRAGYDAHATARLFAVLAADLPDPDQLVAAAALPGLPGSPAASTPAPVPQSPQGGLW